MITMERASELVRSASTSQARIDLFVYFEELLNPHFGKNEDKSADWCITFAEMCGYGIARNVTLSSTIKEKAKEEGIDVIDYPCKRLDPNDLI